MRYKKYAPQAQKKQMPDLSSPAALAILQAARECFLEKEYSQVTFREIAARAQVTSGLIPYYFTSKERLVSLAWLQLADEIDSQIHELDLSALNSAEQLYVTVYLQWIEIDENPAYARFYYSSLEKTLGQFWGNSQGYKNRMQAMLADHNLEVDERENEIFQIASRGATRELVLQRYYKQRRISREEIMDITTSNYFYNLGISDELISKTISASKDFLEKNFPDKAKELY